MYWLEHLSTGWNIYAYVLDGTFGALYYVDHIPDLTIGGGFYSKPLASGCAAKHGACSYMCTYLTAWLEASAITLECYSCLAMRHSY